MPGEGLLGAIKRELELYYNFTRWSDRVAFFVHTLSVKSPFNWVKYPVFDRLNHWVMRHDYADPRWMKKR